MYLVIDVSSLAYTSYSRVPMYSSLSDNRQFNVIPYILSKVTNFTTGLSNVIFCFDPDKTEYRGNSEYKKVYATDRGYNPQVLWEINILRKSCEILGIPYQYNTKYKADHLIEQVCEDLLKLKENIFVLSADQDLISCVRIRGEYSTEIRSFNIKSYDVKPQTMYDIVGVPYNFMSAHKMIHGCKSDNIPPLSGSKALWDKYISVIKDSLDIEDINQAVDHVDPFDINTYDFLETVIIDELERTDLQEELSKRKLEIYKPLIKLKQINKVNWERYNVLGSFFDKSDKYHHRMHKKGTITDDELEQLTKLFNSDAIKVNSFNPESSCLFGSGNIDDLIVEKEIF